MEDNLMEDNLEDNLIFKCKIEHAPIVCYSVHIPWDICKGVESSCLHKNLHSS